MSPSNSPRDDLPTDVAALLKALLPAMKHALADYLVGAYLTGSLALGGYDPETSDVDVVVVTERAIAEVDLAPLKALHDRLPPMGNEYGV